MMAKKKKKKKKKATMSSAALRNKLLALIEAERFDDLVEKLDENDVFSALLSIVLSPDDHLPLQSLVTVATALKVRAKHVTPTLANSICAPKLWTALLAESADAAELRKLLPLLYAQLCAVAVRGGLVSPLQLVVEELTRHNDDHGAPKWLVTLTLYCMRQFDGEDSICVEHANRFINDVFTRTVAVIGKEPALLGHELSLLADTAKVLLLSAADAAPYVCDAWACALDSVLAGDGEPATWTKARAVFDSFGELIANLEGYAVLEPRMAKLFAWTKKTLTAAAAAAAADDDFDKLQLAALAAIEMWSALCDVETLAEPGGQHCFMFVQQAAQHMFALLLAVLESASSHGNLSEEQAQSADSLLLDQDWTLSSAAPTCLALIASHVDGSTLCTWLSALRRRATAQDAATWQSQRAVLLALGAVFSSASERDDSFTGLLADALRTCAAALAPVLVRLLTESRFPLVKSDAVFVAHRCVDALESHAQLMQLFDACLSLLPLSPKVSKEGEPAKLRQDVAYAASQVCIALVKNVGDGQQAAALDAFDRLATRLLPALRSSPQSSAFIGETLASVIAELNADEPEPRAALVRFAERVADETAAPDLPSLLLIIASIFNKVLSDSSAIRALLKRLVAAMVADQLPDDQFEDAVFACSAAIFNSIGDPLLPCVTSDADMLSLLANVHRRLVDAMSESPSAVDATPSSPPPLAAAILSGLCGDLVREDRLPAAWRAACLNIFVTPDVVNAASACGAIGPFALLLGDAIMSDARLYASDVGRVQLLSTVSARHGDAIVALLATAQRDDDDAANQVNDALTFATGFFQGLRSIGGNTPVLDTYASVLPDMTAMLLRARMSVFLNGSLATYAGSMADCASALASSPLARSALDSSTLTKVRDTLTHACSSLRSCAAGRAYPDELEFVEKASATFALCLQSIEPTKNNGEDDEGEGLV
jgi:hypothetical protein